MGGIFMLMEAIRLIFGVSKVQPSLTLFPSYGNRKFSHAELGQGLEYPYHVITHRDIYTQGDIDDINEQADHVTEDRGCLERLKPGWQCSKDAFYGILTSLFPVISTVRNYQVKEYILGDFLSGISVACMHFPQGLAYGLLSSLSPAMGLYASFFPVLFYTIFGMSQHMSIGPDAVMAIITAETVESEAILKFGTSGRVPLNGTTITDDDVLMYKGSVAAGCSLLAGCILTIMGVFRLGFLTSYQSTSFIGGFTTAASFQIFTSQIPKALGLTIPLIKGPGKLVFLYMAVLENIHKTNWISLALVVVSVLFLLFFKDFINVRYKEKLKMPVPADLLLMILATVISAVCRLHVDEYPVELVGHVTSGLPSPTIPNLGVISRIINPSLQMAMISFFLTIAMAKLLAEKHEYEINDNQELMAYGLLNISSSFFYCFPACTSPPRSMLLSCMGARTTLNGLFTAGVLLLILLVLGQFFVSLPVPVLAAMILVSVKPLLLQVRSLRKLFRINRYDFVIWVVTCLSGVLIDLSYGLVGGIAVSFIVFVVQSQLMPVTPVYRDARRIIFVDNDICQIYPEGSKYERNKSRIKICRINSSLFFATSDCFRKTVYNLTVDPLKILLTERANSQASCNQKINTSTDTMNASDPQSPSTEKEEHDNCGTEGLEHSENKIKAIILVCNAVSYIDIQGVNALSVVFEEYKRVGITVYLAGCTRTMTDRLKRSNFYRTVSPECVFYQVEDAYQAAMKLLQ